MPSDQNKIAFDSFDAPIFEYFQFNYSQVMTRIDNVRGKIRGGKKKAQRSKKQSATANGKLGRAKY